MRLRSAQRKRQRRMLVRWPAGAGSLLQILTSLWTTATIWPTSSARTRTPILRRCRPRPAPCWADMGESFY